MLNKTYFSALFAIFLNRPVFLYSNPVIFGNSNNFRHLDCAEISLFENANAIILRFYGFKSVNFIAKLNITFFIRMELLGM
jgi:hypothetical protein